MQLITDVMMVCTLCGEKVTVGACEPDVDGDGSLGCPQPDCGGLMTEVVPLKSTATLEEHDHH